MVFAKTCESQRIEFVLDIAFHMQKGHQNDVAEMDSAKAFDKVAHNNYFTNCHPMRLREIL